MRISMDEGTAKGAPPMTAASALTKARAVIDAMKEGE